MGGRWSVRARNLNDKCWIICDYNLSLLSFIFKGIYCLMGRLVFQLIHNDQNYANLFYKKAFLLFSYFIFFPFIILYKYHIISFIKNQAAGGTNPKAHQPRRRNYEKHLSNTSFFGVGSSLTNSLHSKLNSKNSGRK